MSVVRTRFAPSPTYYLHLGHAVSAFHVWSFAREHGGEVLLRVEDIDTTRCRPEYTEAIFEDLAWLELTWPEPVRVQSEHFGEYRRAVEALTEQGLTYRCFRSRRELAQLSDPKRPGPHAAEEEARRLAAGEAFAWRLSLDACQVALGSMWDTLSYQIMTQDELETHPAVPGIEGDIVLARKDSPSAYHLAATHDDALQGITHIVRGMDLVEAPHIQTLLQVLFGWPRPIYLHHPLLLDGAGEKLSKRKQSQSLARLRAEGVTPAQIRAQLGFG